MITLITGTPGAGKTLFALTEVFPQFKDRKVFVDGVPDLLLDHELPAGPLDTPISKTELLPKIASYADWLPDNSVLIVDECQRVWRPRSAASQVPPGVEAMETHRHHGHDLVLITQHPNLLDGNVRRLIGRHLHVRRVWGMPRAIIYEWDCATDPNRVSTATKRTWSYPKKSFGIYKSASVHTSRGQRPPWLFYALFVLPVVLGFFGWRAYSSIKDRAAPAAAAVTGAPASGIGAAAAPSGYEVKRFVPVNPDLPISAPAYDHLRQVVAAPSIMACVMSSAKCICYSPQATRLQVSELVCREYAANPPFDPYTVKTASNDFRPVPQPAPASAPASSENSPLKNPSL